MELFRDTAFLFSLFPYAVADLPWVQVKVKKMKTKSLKNLETFFFLNLKYTYITTEIVLHWHGRTLSVMFNFYIIQLLFFKKVID